MIAANEERDRLRAQLKAVAKTATARVRALQDELQEELADMQENLLIARVHTSALARELKHDEESVTDVAVLQATLRARLQAKSQCRGALHYWGKVARTGKPYRKVLARGSQIVCLSPGGLRTRRAFASWKHFSITRKMATSSNHAPRDLACPACANLL